jgi:uncharacterized OsmC-like protein
MDAAELRARQAPLKELYRAEPDKARATLRVRGRLDTARQSCTIETGFGPVVEAGLHPAAGGDGRSACSGDMLLQSLVACAGVTLGAVATALGVAIRGGFATAEGDLDFRGTLGVSREIPVGFSAIRLRFTLDTDAPAEQLDNLLRLTERYCVVLQTFRGAPGLAASWDRGAGADGADRGGGQVGS